MTTTRKDWHQKAPAQALLASLTEQDLYITHSRDSMGERILVFGPATDHGQRVFERLEKLRVTMPNRLFLKAATDQARQAIMAWSQRRATVQGALASRFGDPDRFRGHPTNTGAATRAFRATFADKVEWAA